jgi:hypothetical protein
MDNSAFPTEMKPQFSGHETFPLRYGWLKKVHDAVKQNAEQGIDTKEVFSKKDAIARFGVGKNMVASMRYWALAAGMIREVRAHLGPYETTDDAELIFDDRGLDPWMENPNTLWLLHWRFASAPERTSTWYWVFNHCPHASFDRSLLVDYLLRICRDRGLKVAIATLKRDVECFVRTYVDRDSTGTKEDTLECPLTELSLIRNTGRKEMFQIARGAKPSLPTGTLAYAVADYWRRNFAEARTLSFDVLMHAPGSPGRVFALDEESLADYLVELDAETTGKLVWSETAGMRQLISPEDPKTFDLPFLLKRSYKSTRRMAA